VRIVFLGTPGSAVPALEALLHAGHIVPLVISQPDRPAGRSSRPLPPSVKEAALAEGLAVAQPLKVRTDEFLSTVASARPDVVVVVAYGRILPAQVLRSAHHGAVNVHFSLLPRYRGAAPVPWALARGEETTGVTTMAMNERLDEGDILLQREVRIEPGEHCPELVGRLASIGASLLVETLSKLESQSLHPRPQDPAVATYAPRLTPEDGIADLDLTAREVEGRVRGFDPWPGVWVRRAGRRLRIARARARGDEQTEESPGRVIGFENEAFRLACSQGTVLEILGVQPQDKRILTAREALNGRHLLPGDQLEGKAKAS